LETGLRQEGLFYSARAFFAKASFSFGHLVGGVGLDKFVLFPSLAVPGAVDPDVLFRMGILAGPIMGIASFIAVFFYSKYHLTHSMHAKIINDIEERERNQQRTNAKAT
jgi:Na+/melibiose symporter-like transporter